VPGGAPSPPPAAAQRRRRPSGTSPPSLGVSTEATLAEATLVFVPFGFLRGP